MCTLIGLKYRFASAFILMTNQELKRRLTFKVFFSRARNVAVQLAVQAFNNNKRVFDHNLNVTEANLVPL